MTFLRRAISASLSGVRRVPRHCRQTIRTRRLGTFSADRGLDALTFFLADLQTGLGPFVAIYLTSGLWSTADIGTALGIGTAVAMIAQVPAGIGIDAVSAKRGTLLVALLGVLASALLFALRLDWWAIVGAETLYGVASAMLVPAVTAVTLSRVGREGLAHRLGRNGQFMALGNGIGAVLMGAAGAYVAPSAPFWIAGATTLPALLALLALPPRHQSEPPLQRRPAKVATKEGWRVLRDRRLLAFVVCVASFQAGNAFILPLAMNRLTMGAGGMSSNQVLAACLVVSQAMVAVGAPWVGRRAERWGRRPMLLLGFAAVPLHAALLAFAGGIPWVIAGQLLDGAGGAMFGVLQPLVASDITKGTNRFNLVLGVLGLASGLGATASATLGGHLAARFGDKAGFGALAGLGLAAVVTVALLMPETRLAESDAGQPVDRHARA